jgi:hypothetical protein
MAELESLLAKMVRNDTIKPELVAVVAGMDKHATFHPTMAIEGEQLPKGFVYRCFEFLINTNIYKAKVNKMTVKRDTLHLQKHAILTYFVGDKQPS